MPRPRLTIARLMAVVLVVALDCAVLRAAFPTYDAGFFVAVPVLEVGLFRTVSRRGRIRPYWVGFEAFGWTALLADAAGLRRPLHDWTFNVLLPQAIRSCAPRWPEAPRGLEFLFLGDGLLLGLLPLAALLGAPVLLSAWIGGHWADRIARRRSGDDPAATPDPRQAAPASVS